MASSNLSPLSVVPFGRDYLIDFIRHKTGWTQRDEVANKAQLIYLCNYLSQGDGEKCQTIVAEDEYVDRHYLEDYSEYYARCFPSHPRKCSRLHFFSVLIEEHEFVSGLIGNDEVFKKRLADSYIGFAVIRPIPHTFFAKICLKPYGAFAQRPKSKILQKDIPVSLFGISLTVKTIPFLEQDKVVSACATSALWTALSASAEMSYASLPSPSAITKSASNAYYEGTRTFPTVGLTPRQAARSLKYYGMEPVILGCKAAGECAVLKEHIHSYISNGTPVMMGGDVYEVTKDGTHRLLGKHLVCVLGYSTKAANNGVGLKLLSHEIDKIYVHDDRYGPFVKIKMAVETFDIGGKEIMGLSLSIDGKRKDIFVPEVTIVGLHHKVRIPYSYIWKICTTFLAYLQLTMRNILQLNADPKTASQADLAYDFQAGQCIQILIDGVWDISLTTSVAIKQNLLNEGTFCTFNGMINKTSLLLQNMPKHVWRCRVFVRGETGESLFTDLLFDATEVPQGQLLIGYISYSIAAQTMWDYVEMLISNRVWQQYPLRDEDIKQLIGCIIKFFGEKKEEIYLNTQYGPLGLPRRMLKPGETDRSDNIQLRQDTTTVRRGSAQSNWQFLQKDIRYIWVIDEFGNIVLGEDVCHDGEYQGHPTLIDGKPGRVGGELFYVEEAARWKANLKSRAYSGHLGSSRAIEAKGYLSNVIAVNFKGLLVQAA